MDLINSELEAVKPALVAHGGNIEFISFDEKKGILLVKLTGTCQGCPMAQITLKEGIETHLKEKIPAIKKVEAV